MWLSRQMKALMSRIQSEVPSSILRDETLYQMKTLYQEVARKEFAVWIPKPSPKVIEDCRVGVKDFIQRTKDYLAEKNCP